MARNYRQTLSVGRIGIMDKDLIDIGSGEVRQIVTGIAEFVKPEDLVGTKVIVVANLKPAKIKGVESKGMLLVGEDDELVNVLTSTCKVGTRIR